MGSSIKQNIYQVVSFRIDERIEMARQSMKYAQEAANTEEKSSAGDKYETGRAMAQMERDKAAQQLDEALQLKSVLERIDSSTVSKTIGLGSLVITEQNAFYICVSMGSVAVDGVDYFVVSPHSPVGRILINAKLNQEIIFNKQPQRILEIQ